MGPLLVFVFLCFSFRENVIVTCNIVPFLSSSDNVLQKNVIIFFYGNQISKWCSFEKKRAYLNLLFTFFSTATREKTHKFLQLTSHLYTHTYFAHRIEVNFLPSQFWRKKMKFIMYGFSLVLLLLLILLRAILGQSINNKMFEQNLS